jgi:hypothetical protein
MHPAPTPIRIRSVRDMPTQEKPVVVITASQGAIMATLRPSFAYVRPAGSNRFQKTHIMEVAGEIASGDSGSTVVDGGSGDLYGSMVRGCPGSRTAYVLSAKTIFENIAAELRSQVSIDLERSRTTTSGNVSASSITPESLSTTANIHSSALPASGPSVPASPPAMTLPDTTLLSSVSETQRAGLHTPITPAQAFEQKPPAVFVAPPAPLPPYSPTPEPKPWEPKKPTLKAVAPRRSQQKWFGKVVLKPVEAALGENESHQSSFPRLSKPVPLIRSSYDCVVIGSGYGGGVAASRMARTGKSVCLLERGSERWPGEYPSSASEVERQVHITKNNGRTYEGEPTGMFHLVSGSGINVLVGNGEFAST